jgi:NAD(P)-dependent dehydrogenase (short-subunit alcohol dehydrogenase family)
MRKVVVSGGTGALGRAVVEAFLGQDCQVTVPWIVKAEREELAGLQAEALSDGRLALIEADIAEESGAAEVARAAGQIDVLVCACGGFAGGPPVHETALEEWDRMYRMNLRSAAALSRALIPGMRARGGGAILLVASQAAHDRPAGLAAYSAAKAGVMVLAETLQKELASDGIRVNAVVPTTIDTPANRAAMPDADFAAWTAPAEIAGVMVWLASDAAASVRGGLIPV